MAAHIPAAAGDDSSHRQAMRADQPRLGWHHTKGLLPSSVILSCVLAENCTFL
jgi:hypothetical protein